MERLTIRNSDGSVSQPTGLNWAAALERLAAYEDTGLEPCETNEKYATIMAFKRLRLKISLARLCEILQAETEGRCVVLPCKMGDPVWRLYDDCDFPGDCYTKQKCRGCEYRNLFIEEQAFCLSMLSQNGELNPPYYTTREEAEAALKEAEE